MKPFCSILAVLLFLGILTAYFGARSIAAEAVDYVRDVKPILAKHCVNCHGPQKQRAGLRLDSAKAILEGGNSGATLIPGKSGESLLILALTGSDQVKPMPPKELPRVPPEQIAVLRAWIDSGAKAPATETVSGTDNKSSHWAFQPIKRHAVPQVKDVGWVRNPIDAFILAKLQAAGLKPSPEADRNTLARRVSLDLTGLPPTLADLEAIQNDKSLDWYERYVDRLLASPHYGERMARH